MGTAILLISVPINISLYRYALITSLYSEIVIIVKYLANHYFGWWYVEDYQMQAMIEYAYLIIDSVVHDSLWGIIGCFCSCIWYCCLFTAMLMVK